MLSPSIFDDNHIIGGLVIVVVVAATMFSYFSARTGLPFVPMYDVNVRIPDATSIEIGAPVRVGGARVGVVKRVDAVPTQDGKPAYAELALAVDRDLEPLPADSRVIARPISVLGGKYVALTLGHSGHGLKPGEPLALSRAVPTVDIDQALRMFDKPTARVLRRAITGWGDGLAGRGSAVNRTIASLSSLIEPLQRVAETLAAPSTGLNRLIVAGREFGQALEPGADDLAAVLRHGAPALRALRADGALRESALEFPQTNTAIQRALPVITPVLADAAGLARDLRPGTRRLAGTLGDLDVALRRTRRSLRLTPVAAQRTITMMRALERVVRAPDSVPALRVLTQVFKTSIPPLRAVEAAQRHCNVVAIALRNYGESYTEGDMLGSWARSIGLQDPAQQQSGQAGAPAQLLHANPYPNENEHECEAGNEPFLGTQMIGNVPGNQSRAFDQTEPPAGVRERARTAGLVEDGR